MDGERRETVVASAAAEPLGKNGGQPMVSPRNITPLGADLLLPPQVHAQQAPLCPELVRQALEALESRIVHVEDLDGQDGVGTGAEDATRDVPGSNEPPD